MPTLFMWRFKLWLMVTFCVIFSVSDFARADPRQDEIQALQAQLKEQNKQIEELRQAISELRRAQGEASLKTSAPQAKAQAIEGTTAVPASADGKSDVPSGRQPSAVFSKDGVTADNPQQSEALETDRSTTTAEPGADDDPGPEPPPPLEPSRGSTASASGQQPLLNPNISVIGLFEGRAGGAVYDPTKDSMYLREIELALQAPIDPYARADVYLSFPHLESPEVEEATLTWTGLGAGFQAKAGVLKADFGRINPLHSHALPQVDLPLPNQAIFGSESLHNPGLEVSWLAPTPWYSRLSFQAMSRSMGSDVADTTFLPGQNPLTGQDLIDRLEGRDDFTVFPSGAGKGLLYVGRWENLWDLNESTTLQLGLSGATSSFGSSDLKRSLAYGADLTLKWHPLAQPHRSLVWQTEFLRAHQDFVRGKRDFGGWSSFVNYQWNRNWAAGLRYDMTELPFDSALIQRRGTAMLEWSPSEFSRFRLQYNLNTSNYQPSFSEVMLQWNVVLGPHGAHKY